MNPKIEVLSQISGGGTIIDLSADSKGRLWAATSAGLFRQDGDSWYPFRGNLPFPQVSTLLQVRKRFFIGGAAGGIAYSLDAGDSWHRSWVDQVDSPVACMIPSPSYSKDYVLLAGTQGQGILRSTDGGRHWQLENFGLQGFSVFGLAAVAVERSFRELDYTRDYVYAATDDGIYFSPNEGRAWKPAGKEMAGKVFLSVAVSSNFDADQTVYAGCETGQVYRSRDEGASWQRLDLGHNSPGAINSILCLKSGEILIGTSEGGILASKDGGDHWSPTLTEETLVICLKQIEALIYAGLYQVGLMKSKDGGCSWNKLEAFSARQFEWLVRPKPDTFLCAGLEEGLWKYKDGEWAQLSTWNEAKGVLGIHSDSNLILVAAVDGIWRSDDSGSTWKRAVEAAALHPHQNTFHGRFRFASTADIIWCGGENGMIYWSSDLGESWDFLKIPFEGNPVIAITALRGETWSSLVAGVLEAESGSISIYYTEDETRWSKWLSVETGWYSLNIATTEEKHTKMVILGLGSSVLAANPNDDPEILLDLDDEPITALATSPTGNEIAVATLDRFHFRDSDGQWESFGEVMLRELVVDIIFPPQFPQGQSLFALTSTGKLLRIRLEDESELG